MDMSGDHTGHESHGKTMDESGDRDGHDHQEMMKTASPGSVGIDEKTGAVLPSGIRLRDETGNLVQLDDLIDRPTILLPVYYECPGVCGILMSSLAMVHRGLPRKDRDTYRAVTVSFDADDTPESAAMARRTYLSLLDPDFPKDNWRFLTGDQHNIDRLLNAIGYKVFQQEKHLFQHPNALIVLSAEGQVIRYIYGTRFLPFDVGMALMEAEKGTPGVSMKKVLSYCFEYDPDENRYTFQYIRIFGLIIPLLLFLFYFFFLRKGNVERNRRNNKREP